MSTATSSPQVYRAINAITAAFAHDGIAKLHTNIRDQYQYRSIDDVLNRLGPLLAKHRLCILPRVVKHRTSTCAADAEGLVTKVRLLAAFDLVSARDGSSHTVQGWGEALDAGDKATAKAMSSAYKCAMLQTFCVPVATDDGDAASYRLKVREVEPVEGWQGWSDGILDMIRDCESPDALDRVRTRQGSLLNAVKRERPDLYAGIGEGFATRGQQLSAPTVKPPARPKVRTNRAEPRQTADA
jgi:hypothetical protein